MSHRARRSKAASWINNSQLNRDRVCLTLAIIQSIHYGAAVGSESIRAVLYITDNLMTKPAFTFLARIRSSILRFVTALKMTEGFARAINHQSSFIGWVAIESANSPATVTTRLLKMFSPNRQCHTVGHPGIRLIIDAILLLLSLPGGRGADLLQILRVPHAGMFPTRELPNAKECL